MKKNIILLLVIAVVLSFSINIFAEEAAQEESAGEQAAVEETVTLSKEEILENLRNALEYNSDLVPTIQGLQVAKDESGNFSYQYNGTKLEDLDQETLMKI